MIANTVLASILRLNENERFFIQAGAFKNETNAETLLQKLSEQSNQEWFIQIENDLFKVRLGYFDSQKIADSVKESLNNIICFVAIKKNKEEVKNEEVAQVAIEKEIFSKVSIDSASFIQAGAFRNQNNAENLKAELSTVTSLNWFIENESGFYKVRYGKKSLKVEYLLSINNQTRINNNNAVQGTAGNDITEQKDNSNNNAVQGTAGNDITEQKDNSNNNAVQGTAGNDITEQKDNSNNNAVQGTAQNIAEKKYKPNNAAKGGTAEDKITQQKNKQIFIILIVLIIFLSALAPTVFFIIKKRKRRRKSLKDADLT